MVVDAAEPSGVDVAVDLRGRERRVAEQLLDRAQVGAALRAGALRTRAAAGGGGGRAFAGSTCRGGVPAPRRTAHSRRRARAAVAPRAGSARRDALPPRRGGRRGPSRPCRGGRARAPARSRRRRGRGRPPPRCAAPPSRRARRARGSGWRAHRRRRRRRRSRPPRSASAHRAGGGRVAVRASLRDVRSGPSEKRSSARMAASLRAIVDGASFPPGRARPSSVTQSARTRTSTSSSGESGPNHRANSREVGGIGAASRVGDPSALQEAPIAESTVTIRCSAPRVGSPAGGPDRFTPLAELAVHGANVQPGQTVIVSARPRSSASSRARSPRAAYKRGARFVDVWLLRSPREARARSSTPTRRRSTFVPAWYGQRLLEHAEGRGARVTFAGSTAPDCSTTSTPSSLGRDRLPLLKEVTQIITDRTTNWCIVPCPHADVGEARLPGALRRGRATSSCGTSSSTCCVSTSPIRGARGTSGWTG